MANLPKLSVCIPNYGRAGYIADTLDSIVEQKVPGIEIIVVDDHSTDGAWEVIQDYFKKHPKENIRIYQNKKNLGFDRNVLRVMSLAKAEYCWLFGNDDNLLPGSIKKVLEVVKKHPDAVVIHTNYTRYDEILKKLTSEAMVGIKEDLVFTAKNQYYFKPLDKNSYFKYLSTNVLTMSTDILNRKKWLNAVEDCKEGLGHNFIHCFIIAKLVSENNKIIYIGKPLVQYRCNNHRIWPNDIWKDYNKILIDFLIKKDFDREKALEMREKQKIYEVKEQELKTNRILKAMENYPRVMKIVLNTRLKVNQWLGTNI